MISTNPSAATLPPAPPHSASTASAANHSQYHLPLRFSTAVNPSNSFMLPWRVRCVALEILLHGHFITFSLAYFGPDHHIIPLPGHWTPLLIVYLRQIWASSFGLVRGVCEGKGINTVAGDFLSPTSDADQRHFCSGEKSHPKLAKPNYRFS